ncbi:MAG: S24 family peptidase [Clostridia bacterium]
MSDLGNKEIFAKNLQYYMEINNKDRNDLARDLNLPYTTITSWCKGEFYPRIDKIQLLANYFNIQKADLVESRNILAHTSNSAVVFVYGTIPAGIPMECIEDIIDTEEISADMLKGDKQFFGLKVNGHSMEPDYLDGDTIILEKVEDCESGTDCVVMVNGNDGTFKRVIKNEENQTIRLQPLNTSLDENGMPLYEPITFTKEQIKSLPVRIIGKVVELRRKK